MTVHSRKWMERWPQLLAAGLSLLALASVWKTAPAHIGAGMALIAAVVGVFIGPRPRWDAVDTTVTLLAAWLVVRFALQQHWGLGEAALVQPRRGFLDWLWPLLFALIAIDRNNAVQRVSLVWLAAMTGFAIGVVSYFLSQGIGPLLSGARLGFHLQRPLGAGLYAGAFLLSLAFTAQFWWRVDGRWRWPARLGGAAMLLLCSVVLIGSQNRSTWLGLAAVGLAVAIWVTVRALRHHAEWRRTTTLLILGVALLTGVALIFKGPLESRTADERDAISTVLAEGLDAAPATNITIRLRLWSYALDQFRNAPLLGHGFGGVQEALERDLRSGAPLLERERQDHLHNTYLQALYGQGLVGCLLWAALGALLFRDLMRAARQNREIRRLMPAAWAVVGFTAIWALTDYRLSHPDMRFFSILLLLSLRLLGCAQPPSSKFR